MTIKEQFNKFKIHQMQLDPFGVCNAKCWFCPVKYKGNPQEGKETMSIELLEKIIKNLVDERDKEDGLVAKTFNGFYTAHYNEILLYKYFKEFLQICRKYKMQTMILTNGVPMTPEKTDMIAEYKDVINGVCFNIPSFSPNIWSKRAGININQYNKLVNNVIYAIQKLDYMVKSKALSIQMNGVNDMSFSERGGWIDKGENFPLDIDLNPITGELAEQYQIAQKMFPNVQIFTVPSLIDRAGLLADVISNKGSIERNLMQNQDKKVIGCGNGFEVGGRPIGWIHVNAAGDAFLCCNDYDFDFKFGNFKTQQLSDFWGKQEHIDKIQESYDTICRNCASAIFGNK